MAGRRDNLGEQKKVFYGWVIVFAGLAFSLIMYGIIESFAIMFKPIATQFNWDRGTVSMASLINWLSFGVSSLICGALSDRFGSRAVIVSGGVVFVAGTFLMSQVQSLWQLYLFFGVLLAVGRSAAGVPLTALITKWFVRRQGLALALAQSQNVGSAIFAPLAVVLLTAAGWRGAYIWLGLITLLIIPLSLLIRDQPRRAVRATDATSSAIASPVHTVGLQSSGMRLGQAVQTRAFWTLNLMVMGCCICHSCILLHGVNHMTDVGIHPSVAANVVAVMALFGMAGKVANGLLADRIGPKWALALFLGLQAVMIPFFIEARQAPSFFWWAVLFGFGFGGPMPVYAMLFREYFGTRSIGTLLGVFFMVASIGMGFGGLMAGVMYNTFGSYAVPFLTGSTTGLFSAILALTLPSSRAPVPVSQLAALQPS